MVWWKNACLRPRRPQTAASDPSMACASPEAVASGHLRQLLSELKAAEAPARRAAIHALANASSPAVNLALLNSLRDSDPQVRLAAATVLEQRSDPDHALFFLGLLLDESFELRLTAIRFVSRLADPQAAFALLPLLEDFKSDVRGATAEALGNLGNPKALEPLMLALADENRMVRAKAWVALRQIDPGWVRSEAALRARARLTELARDSRPLVRQGATEALKKMTTSDRRL